MTPVAHMVFRAGRMLAIPLVVAQELIAVLPTTPVPHRRHPGFKGLVDWQGRVVPCVCLPTLFSTLEPHRDSNKMLVLNLCGETVVCPVERVLGIRKLEDKDIVPKEPETGLLDEVTRGKLPDGEVLVLDEEKLYSRMKEILSHGD